MNFEAAVAFCLGLCVKSVQPCRWAPGVEVALPAYLRSHGQFAWEILMSVLAEGDRIGPYLIIRQLGAGGMGEVYEARQEPLNRRVAIKTLHAKYTANQDLVTRFFNEAKVLSRLEHPSIVQVADFGHAANGTAYLVMEYLRGQSLGRRLRARDGRLPLVASLQMTWQIAEVMAMAHAQGVVHRDLKPENLMFVADPVAPAGERVKVLDFGIAKLTGALEKDGLKTDTQMVIGTPMYMSPEQCSGARAVDEKSDVYSLGCVLYQVLSGRPPFVATGAGELMGMHLFHEPPPISTLVPKLPKEIGTLVHRLLVKDKALRPNMSETADEIERLLAKLSSAGTGVRSRVQVETKSEPINTAALPNPPTTIGLSRGQSLPHVGKRGWLLASGIAGITLPCLFAVLHAQDASSEPPANRVAASAPAAAGAIKPSSGRVVHWRIDSDPAGATVIDRDGKVVGVTPWIQQIPAGNGQAAFRLQLDGYNEDTATLEQTADTNRKVFLLAKPATSARSAARTGSTNPRSGGHSAKGAKRRGIPYEE